MHTLRYGDSHPCISPEGTECARPSYAFVCRSLRLDAEAALHSMSRTPSHLLKELWPPLCSLAARLACGPALLTLFSNSSSLSVSKLDWELLQGRKFHLFCTLVTTWQSTAAHTRAGIKNASGHMNTKAKRVNKILTQPIHSIFLKYIVTKWSLSWECENGSLLGNQR